MKRLVVVLACVAAPAHADAPVWDPAAGSPNKPGFHREEVLTGDWGGVRKDWLEDGFKIQMSYSGDVFAAPGLDGDRVVTMGLAALELDFDLEKLVSEKLGRIQIETYGIHGGSLSQRLMDVFTVSNNAADPDIRVYEAYVEQPLGPVSIRAGLLAADQQFTLANTSVVLMNATFGIMGITSYNLTNPTYPVGALGVSLITETGPVKTTLTVFDGDGPSSHGIPTGIGDNTLWMGEVEIAETFKLGTWNHTALGSGYYGVLQRQLGRRLAAFARVGFSPERADDGMDFYADAGIRLGPFRKHDFFSAGLAHADSNVGYQTVIEATYQYHLAGYLTIQPDVQILLDRNGTTGIVALRCIVVL